MELSNQLLCLFSARIEDRGDSFVVEIPRQELEIGDLESGDIYRVAVLQSLDKTIRPAQESFSSDASEHRAPPVTEGEVREVVVEDIGDQGDGIARVERGFVIIVPEATRGETVTVEITNVAENYAIGTIVETDTDDPEFDPSGFT